MIWKKQAHIPKTKTPTIIPFKYGAAKNSGDIDGNMK
jgi:hypothetical protein